MCKTKQTFIYDSHFKPSHQPKYCGALIDNREDALIYYLNDNDRETNLNLKNLLKVSLVYCALWNTSTK